MSDRASDILRSDTGPRAKKATIDIRPSPALARADSLVCRDELQAEYSLDIIKGPSGLAGPEARFLTSWANAILLAVSWNRTPPDIARGVLELPQRDGTISIPAASVLTRVNLKRHVKYRFGDSADLLLARMP
ncbi:hypothetical protein [Mesorhizobium sp. WSM3224]|uniref:hypothetical protein n=1 Tax=Mesorhizobium sp. WSM3224 TaxID=1040986 RepID=UPI00048347A1|nr:hypothetical protein [Mesorhizobium sp. WSM3224]